jgi:hypothetical protein
METVQPVKHPEIFGVSIVAFTVAFLKAPGRP